MKRKAVVSNQSRRAFLSSLGMIGAGSLLPSGVFGSDHLLMKEDSYMPVLKAGPYLQIKSGKKMVVRWLTNALCYSWVEYGRNSISLTEKEHSVHNGLNDAYDRNHAVTLKKLKSGRYYYRICSKVIKNFEPYNVTFGDTFKSPVYSFEIVNKEKESISILVFNDIHDRPESFGKLLSYQSDIKKDFILFNGDMFNYLDGEDNIVDHLFNPFAKISPETPFIFSRGNHETRGNYARHLSEYFKNSGDGFYYSFVAGPAYCIVLDTGEDKNDINKEYSGLVSFDKYRLDEQKWLKKEVKKKSFLRAKYKLVFSHIPLYYSGEGHGTMHCREVFGNILNKAKINVLISGHTHVYGIHPPVVGQHNYPIVIGGGPKNGDRTIIEIEANRKSLNIKIKDDSGILRGQLNV